MIFEVDMFFDHYAVQNGGMQTLIMSLHCYVRQCSLYVYLILVSLHEMCLGVLHYISL